VSPGVLRSTPVYSTQTEISFRDSALGRREDGGEGGRGVGRWDCRAELAFHFLLTFTKISKDEKAGKEFGKSVTR